MTQVLTAPKNICSTWVIFQCVRLTVSVVWSTWGKMACIGRTPAFSSTPQLASLDAFLDGSAWCTLQKAPPWCTVCTPRTFLSLPLVAFYPSLLHPLCSLWDAAWVILCKASFFNCWIFVLFCRQCTLPWMTGSALSYENSLSGQTMPPQHSKSSVQLH